MCKQELLGSSQDVCKSWMRVDAEAEVTVSRIAFAGHLDKRMAWNSLFAMMMLNLSTAGRCRAEPQIGKDELRELLGKPGIYIIDIRSSEEWDHFPYKIGRTPQAVAIRN